MRDDITFGVSDANARWYRNRDGDTVHRSGCRHAAVPWPLNEDWDDERLREYVGTFSWMKACKVCLPEWKGG